ncbi:MAG: FliM/FliN family flagellar motor C-terminal domain-containing protein [Acidobacteriota bacterium]
MSDVQDNGSDTGDDAVATVDAIDELQVSPEEMLNAMTDDDEALRRRLGRMRLRLGVVLGVVRLPLGQLIDLGAGQSLHVDRGQRNDLAITLQGRPLLSGALLERDRRLAVRLSASPRKVE